MLRSCLFSIVLACFLVPASGHAQTRTYGDVCDVNRPCPTGLTCTGGQLTGRCFPICDARACFPGTFCATCPNKESCQTQVGGLGACICQNNQDCPNGLSCVEQQCVGKVKRGGICNANNRCAKGLRCFEKTKGQGTKCWEICNSAKKCSQEKTCVAVNTTLSVCTCSKNSDCNTGVCDSGFCRPGLGQTCTSENRCRTGLTCFLYNSKSSTGTCVPTCSDGICVGGGRCIRLSNGVSACICNANNTCMAGSTCKKGLCDPGVPRCDPQQGCPEDKKKPTVCVRPNRRSTRGLCLQACTTSTASPRPTNMTCTKPTPCRSVNQQKACYCLNNAQCGRHKRCELYRCIDSCRSDGDCRSDQSCLKGMCRQDEATTEAAVEASKERVTDTADAPDAGQPDSGSQPDLACSPACQGVQICKAGRCMNRGFTDPCQSQSDCPNGLICRALPAGQFCLRDIPQEEATPDRSTSVGCQCQQGTASGSLWLFLLFALLFALRRSSPRPSA